MMLRFLLVSVVVSVLAAGCASEEPLECPTCEPPSAELRFIEGTTWLVRDVSFPRETDGVAVGFDLDGIESPTPDPATCEERSTDWPPSLDAPIGGVDNVGQGLIDLGEGFSEDRTFDGELDLAVAAGRIRWAIRVGELLEDREATVPLELLLVDPEETIALDAEGHPAPGQTLGARVVATTMARVSGSVAWGDAANIAPLAEDMFLLPFEDLRLGAIGIQPLAPNRLRAQIGGSFSVEALSVRLVEETDLPYLDIEDARTAFGTVADLEPQADDPTRCTRVSVGFELEAVPATLVVE